ncbi:glycosyltransferase [Rhodococcus sp. KRD162]|uniref:glycosyltransferase n=1 Tax=Rhodococcus sp. KRD162 TaxID=2729725 RepID=UPI003D05F502
MFIPYGGDAPDPLPVVEGLKSRDYVLIVARFVPENTVPEFLEAARELSMRWNVVIVGSSGYGGVLDLAAKKLSEESTRVHWLGHVSDDKKLFSLWQHAGVYFHGHSVGGTNPALVQAMACGAPVVARDTVYNREVLSEVGTFVQPDPASITAAVSGGMVDRSWQGMAATLSYQRSQEFYTWGGVCNDYRTLLEEVTKVDTVRRDALVNRAGGQ